MPDHYRRKAWDGARVSAPRTARRRLVIGLWCAAMTTVVTAAITFALAGPGGGATASTGRAARPVVTAPDGSPAATADPPTASGLGPGYALAERDGTVATFGGAGFAGDLSTAPPASPVVGMAVTRDGRGYWLASAAGAVSSFGDAGTWATGATPRATAAIVADPAGPGYWLVGTDGQVGGFGAPQLGSVEAAVLDGPVVGAAAGAGGRGLWLVTATGQVTSIGQVPPGVHPPTPTAGQRVVGMAATADGRGYWTVSADGQVATAGDAGHRRAAGGLAGPVAALLVAPAGGGYLLALQDGTVVAVGGAVDLGDARSPLHPPYYPGVLQAAPTVVVAGGYLATGRQAASGGPLRVTVLGDSVSVIVGRYTTTYLAAHHLDAAVAIGGIMGCGVTGNLPLATYSSPGPPAATLPACGQWPQQYGQSLASSHPDVVVVLLGYWESQRHLLDGRVVTAADSAAYRRLVAGQLSTVVRMARRAGARVLLVNAPYDGDGTPDANVDAYDTVLSSVARAHGVGVVDLRALLDPGGRYQRVVDGVVARNADAVHPSAAAVTTVIDPALVTPMLALARSARSADARRSG